MDSKIEMPNDLARATQQGKADAERLRRSRRLSDEDRQRLNDALASFEGDAKDEYLRQIKPALDQVTSADAQQSAHAPASTSQAKSPSKWWMVAARDTFVKHTTTEKSLSESEANRVADAVEYATRGLTDTIAIGFFQYYSHHDLEKMSARREQTAQGAYGPYSGRFADTKPHDDTQLRSDVLTFPLERLGPLLLHELGHTEDDKDWMGTNDWEEGHPYAVEYYFAGRTGVVDRQNDIVGVVRGGRAAIAYEKPDMQKLFLVTRATLTALQEVIEDSPTPHLPASVRPDGGKARLLFEERVIYVHPQSDELEAITKYVEGHLSTFDQLPTLSY